MKICNTAQEAVTKCISKKKKRKKAKWLSEEALQIAEETREVKSKGEREIHNQLKSSGEQQGEIRNPTSMNNAKKQRKTIEWEGLEVSSRKLEIAKKYFMQGWAQ